MALTSNGPPVFLSGPDLMSPARVTVVASATHVTRASEPTRRLRIVSLLVKPQTPTFCRNARQMYLVDVSDLDARGQVSFIFSALNGVRSLFPAIDPLASQGWGLALQDFTVHCS